MKRLILYFASVFLAFAVCACGGAQPLPVGSEGSVRIGAMKGATAIGLARYIEDERSNGQASFTIVTADEIVPMLIRGELDMAAVPSTLAATLYNNTNGGIRVVAVNTLGLTYIVEKGEDIRSFEDLRGKTILATGKGSTPEITLRYILAHHGIDPDNDVTLEFKNEPGEVVAWLRQKGGVAMLPQPFVTTAMDKVRGLREVIDLNAAWNALPSGGKMVIGVFVARADYLEQEADISGILAQYRVSTAWVNAYPAEAAKLVEKLGIVPAGVAERAIPKCNATFIDGEEMKRILENFLSAVFEDAPEALGGALPGDDFYYVP